MGWEGRGEDGVYKQKTKDLPVKESNMGSIIAYEYRSEEDRVRVRVRV